MSAPTAEQILYGSIPPLAKEKKEKPTLIITDPYFENDRGHSGTSRWAAKVEQLPDEWKTGSSKGSSRQRDIRDFISLVSDQSIQYFPDKVETIELSEDPSDPSLIKIKGDLQGTEYGPRASRDDMRMVEELLGKGEWLYDPLKEVLYYAVIDNRRVYAQGMVRCLN